MSEKPSINDYGPGDFECQDEFEHWRKHAIAELEAEVEALQEHDGKSSIEVLRLIVTDLRNPSTPKIVMDARANWLASFTSKLSALLQGERKASGE